MQCCGNQITLLYVLGTGDDLDRLVLTDINLTNPHMIGVFMTNNGNDLADNNIFDFGIHTLVGFYFLTEYSQLFNKVLVGYVGEIHELFMQPFSVQFHYPNLLRIDSGIAHRCQKSNAGR